MFDSKESRAVIKWSTVTTICVSVIGFLGTQVWGILSEKLHTIEANKEALTIVQAKSSSDEAQWRLIQELTKRQTGQEIEIEVLKRLVTNYTEESHNKVVTIKLESIEIVNRAITETTVNQSDDQIIDRLRSQPKPIMKQEEKPVQEYKELLEQADQLKKEDLNQFKNRAKQTRSY